MRMTMENWTHKPPRQGLFSSNAIAKTFTSWTDQRVSKGELLSPESPSSSNIVRLNVWVVNIVNQWWIRMIFRRKFCVPKICSPRSIQTTHTHACHSEVSIRFFGLWSPRPFVAASCKSRCNKGHEVMKNCRDWDFSKSWVGSVAASLSAAHVRKMWRTAERRFVQHDGHVCQRNPFSPFLFGIPSIHSPWEPQHAPSALHDGCIMLAKDRVEVSKIWSTGYWLWSRLSYILVYTRQLQVNEE